MATVARRRSSATVDWDAVAEVALPSELRRAGPDDLRPDSRHDGLLFEDVDLAGMSAEDAGVLECRFSGYVLDEGRWRRARLSSCVLEDVRATALDVSDGKWSDVVVRRGRIGALEARTHRRHLERDELGQGGERVASGLVLRGEVARLRGDNGQGHSRSVKGRAVLGLAHEKEAALPRLRLREVLLQFEQLGLQGHRLAEVVAGTGKSSGGELGDGEDRAGDD